MDSLYLLIPLSVALVLAIAAVLVWSALSGQFDDLESEGRRVLDEDDSSLPRSAPLVKSKTRAGASDSL